MPTIELGSTKPLSIKLSKVSDGTAYTGIAYNTASLLIAVRGNTEAAGSTYTGGNLEDITTLGTYAAPTASKVRFKEVSSTNHPGLYEIHLESGDYSLASTTEIMVTVSGVTDLKPESREWDLVDPPTVAEVAAGLLDLTDGVETSWTVRGALRIFLATLAGKSAGAGTGTLTYRDMADSKNRISATISSGNRTAVTRDAT
jgi:hypothetical protein